MKTLKNLLLSLFVIASVGSMAQNEIKMMNGTVNIGEGKTYYFYDSGGDEEMTVEEDPDNNFRWKTWYNHNEDYTLHLKVPTNSTKGIKVTFRSLLINDDDLRIFEGAPSDTSASTLIAQFTNNDYSKAYNIENFSVMSHGDMTIHFHSSTQWRDAGWVAIIELGDIDNNVKVDYKPQAPLAVLEACADNVVLLPCSKADNNGTTEMYYTINGIDNPVGTESSTEFKYTGPIPITQATTIKTIAVEGDKKSSVSTYPFSTLYTAPNAPTFVYEKNNNILYIKANKPTGLNDTWYARYAKDNNNPETKTDTLNGNNRKDVDTVYLTEPCTIYAVVYGTTCSTEFSGVASYTIDSIYIPDPVIEFSETGSATITCTWPNAKIFYTTNGNDPDQNSTLYTGTITSGISAGTTVKAIAYNDGNDNTRFVPGHASKTYVPGGEGSDGVFGTVVLLDDREDHSWSYYSDGEQPVHSLKPADVKITYFGNGTGTVTSASENQVNPTSFSENATTVAVSGYEPANQFIYLKTLENANEDGSGNYPYTLIPNPFSKRPTVGTISTSAGATCWRGFYGWRVKRLSNGLSVKVGNTTYTSRNINSSSIIPAETEVEFITTSAEGNEVEFEAMWAQAWFATAVNNTSNLNANVTYERNFIRIAAAINSTNTRPATIMELYPNGTTNGTTAATAAPTTSRDLTGYSLSADTKFEFIALNRNGNNNMVANNHYLCFGRGINASRNAARVFGMSAGTSDAVNYMLRLESGQYDQFGFIGSGNWTMSGRVLVKAILGCDYDRAKNDNAKLDVSKNSSMFYSTGGVDFSNSSNMDQKVFDCVVKSGTYQSGVTNDGAYDHSLYCGHNSASAASGQRHYPGVRYITIEGGNFASLNGGRATDGWNDPTYTHDAVCFSARIKGGTFRGSVYGGAADNPSGGSKQIIITGGTIQGWVAGGANGTGSVNGSHATTNGNSYIYVGGNSTIGSTNPPTINGTPGGNVFGAGRGRAAQMASIDISNVVVADNTTIYQNVYGGGYNGTIRNTANVYILGGDLKQNVFGGAYGNDGSVTANDLGGTVSKDIPTSNVYVKGGTVSGSVYGGSNSTGNVGNVTMEITGGTIDTNVHGGGFGSGTNVTGNVVITLGKDTQTTDGVTVNGDVYGGGALGKVNTANPSNTTHVIVNKGTIKGNIYGGGLGKQGTGNAAIKADAGTVTVDINGGKMNKVFGCNNQNGAPQGMVTVNFNGGEAVDVYGGGNEADYTVSDKYPIVNITDGVVSNNVYGGGSLAKVNKTIVNMTGGDVNNVFAGAEGKNKNETLVTGNKTLNMQGGIATAVYGGSFTCLDKAYSFVNISGGHVKTHVFGSGYFGDMQGDCYVYIGENAIKNAPNNTANGDKLTDSLNHNKNIWIESNVYAGANWGSFDGTFGPNTITGKSNIYIDGTDYNMEQGKTGNYMIIGGSVFGSGTSCGAGYTDHSVIIRNYGTMTYPSMTRSLKSIQKTKELVLDNSNIEFVGQGDISSMDITVEYGMCNDTLVRIVNNSNVALSKPMDMVLKLGSYTCSNVYTATSDDYTKTTYTTPSNGIVINNGGYLMVRNNKEEKIYGELEGFFFMHEPGDDKGINNEGYIFARPKLIKGEGESLIEQQNKNWNVFKDDGGFVDFDASKSRNIFDVNGNKAPEQPQPQGMRKAYDGNSVQMAYTNRTVAPTKDRSTETDNGTDYRFWRFDPDTVPTVTREIVFVVKADEDASPSSTKFLTTTGSVQFPPEKSTNNKYYITGLTWGADGKDCNPAPCTKTSNLANSDWMSYDEPTEAFVTTDTTSAANLDEYYANPNATFGFLMQYKGNLKTQADQILNNSTFLSYFNEHALAEINPNNSTALPQLDFLLTYSNRLSQNELWSEARMVIDEVEEIEDEVTHKITRTIKQRIYLNISVTTSTKFGSNVETYVYASTEGNATTTYTASLTLPTFALLNNNLFKADFNAMGTSTTGAEANTNFGDVEVNNTTKHVVDIAEYNHVTGAGEGKALLSLRFYANKNGDNTQGWNNMGSAQYPNQTYPKDFYTVNQDAPVFVGAADGRKYTTITFELQYNPTELKNTGAFNIGQKYLGDLVISMSADNVAANAFNIIVHVYVTGANKFFYLDGVAGKDGNSGMFPDQAKRTLGGVLSASGYTVKDPIFVVNGVEPKANGSLTWDANKFLNAVTVAEEDKDNYTEETLRQLSQVKVYRYPGNHPKKDGKTDNTVDQDNNILFDNGMYNGPIINVPANSTFSMHNVWISGSNELNDATNENYETYNNQHNTIESNYPLISIAAGATVNIDNSSLVNNKNNGTTLAGAIYNEGTLTVDGLSIKDNVSNGYGTGVYQKGEMNLGNTQIINITDQIYLYDQKILTAPNGYLYEGSQLKDILVYHDGHPNPIDVKYSGRVIVRYPNNTPTAPEAPFWKTLVNGEVPQPQSSILKNHKAAGYESDIYGLNEDEIIGFSKANGGDNNVLPYITDEMKAETYAPITNHDIIMYSTKANLPVELLYFTAECMGEATQLQWATASETNNEYFTIERSSDAVNYEEVARIQGAGTSSQRNDYSFMVDNNSTAITYYRLRQTDIDGKYEIFAPIAIQCQNNKAATEISIYPVPANDQVNIFSSNSPMTRIEIYSIMGAKVAEEPAEGNQTTLHIGNLATGVYAAKIHTEDGQVINVRLIKK